MSASQEAGLTSGIVNISYPFDSVLGLALMRSAKSTDSRSGEEESTKTGV
ncbi:hypothetical protein [Nocardiopsis synnemataformans]